MRRITRMSIEDHYKKRSIIMRHKTISMTPEFLNKLHRQEIEIIHILKLSDLPAWYRDTSQFQMDAANNLLNAIRDDTEQCSAHRVQNILLQIGLRPMISSRDAKVIMNLSRGNDLAFLWFLKEMRYKSPPDNYSFNEQLLMSLIAHLDMITTLRELDRILPPASLSKRNVLNLRRTDAHERENRLRLNRMQIQRKNQLRKMKRLSEHDFNSPYFQYLPQRSPYGKPLTLPLPPMSVNFGFYGKYKDPLYVVPNEKNRWFSEYKLDINRRIANDIFNIQLENIFNDYADVTSRLEKVDPLCAHHKAIKELEQSLEDKLKVIARERCLQYIKVDTHKQEMRREQVRKQLDVDVQRHMIQFRALAAKAAKRTTVLTISGECDYDYKQVSSDQVCELGPVDVHLLKGLPKPLLDSRVQLLGEPNPEPEISRPPVFEKFSNKDMAQKHTNIRKHNSSTIFTSKTSHRKSDQGQGDTDSRTSKCDDNSPDDCVSKFDQRPSKSCLGIIENDVSSSHQINFNRVIDGDSISCTSEGYFSAPKEHQPYNFNYPKIYNIEPKQKYERKPMDIQEKFINALDSDMDIHKTGDHLRKSQINDAIHSCVMKTWRTGVKAKTAEMIAQEKPILTPKFDEDSVMSYDVPYYDPDDFPFMKQMLKDALERISKNPKFVLATFPDTYKLPILHEWILQRYGKEYNNYDLHKSYQLSSNIYRNLFVALKEVKLPTLREFGVRQSVVYDCRDYNLHKAQAIKNIYYRRLDNAIMELSRVFWFATHPYLSVNEPPRRTYYAYMPARMTDILHFRIWRSQEYTDVKKYWERRLLEQKRKNYLSS